jgi:hypothetical protein
MFCEATNKALKRIARPEGERPNCTHTGAIWALMNKLKAALFFNVATKTKTNEYIEKDIDNVCAFKNNKFVEGSCGRVFVDE